MAHWALHESRIKFSAHIAAVLRALGVDEEVAHTSIRFGFGRFTTEQEVSLAIHVLCVIIDMFHESLCVGTCVFVVVCLIVCWQIDFVVEAVVDAVVKLRALSPLWEAKQEGGKATMVWT